MLIWLVELSEYFKFLNLFRYITFRTGLLSSPQH